MAPSLPINGHRLGRDHARGGSRVALAAAAALLALSSAAAAGASSSSSASERQRLPVSPVAQWDPSWAASSAQGTTVVVSFEGLLEEEAAGAGGGAPDESERRRHRAGCVVVLRSPAAASAAAAPGGHDGGPAGPEAAPAPASREDGAPLVARWIDAGSAASDRAAPAAGAGGRWAWVPPSNLLCLTGLASDADHLAGSVLAGADRRQTLYEGSDHAVPSPLDVVLELSEALRDSARGHESGRPFGVQCLVVGLVPPRRRAKATEASPAFAIFTLDPSGGYRHWGAATAIGRGAGRVRRNVHELLLSTSSGGASGGGLPRTAEDALRLALNATMAAFEADLPPPSSSSAPPDGGGGDASHYAALVLEAGAGSRGTEEPDVGIVDPRRVRAVVRELVGSRSAARAAGNYG